MQSDIALTGYGYDDVDPMTGRRRSQASGGPTWEQVQRQKARALLVAVKRLDAVAKRLVDLQLDHQPEVSPGPPSFRNTLLKILSFE
jgi:hypothetical protein